ncbi:MAG: type VI secretion system baseplate subunit TssF [Myxococcota bacterium]
MFRRYYQSELTYLRELGKEFAERNPALASTLGERGGDPDVERLLEGFAFLSARIRERIDSAVPEIVDALGELVVPQAFRPVPASTIMQFSPNGAAIRGHYRVEAGTEVGSRPVRGTQCIFRTTAPADLFPLHAERSSLDPSVESRPKMRLQLRVEGDVRWPAEGALRLFLDGPPGLASTVFLWLSRHLASVTLESGGRSYVLRPRVATPALTEAMPLLPWPDHVPDGLRLVQEYFTLRQKMLFVDVLGFEALPDGALVERADLVFEFAAPPRLPERLTEDLFRLHCTPAVNLFQVDGNPVVNDSAANEHMVRVTSMDPDHVEIYSVDKVTSTKRGEAAGGVELSPFFAFAHPKLPPNDQRFFALRRAISPLDRATDTYLSIIEPADVAPSLSDEVLSFELSCTNRDLPTELGPGDVCMPRPTSPTVATFRNVVPLSRPTRPAAGLDKHWRLLSHLGANTRTLTSPEALRAVLAHSNLHEETDQQLYETNRLRIDSIRSVKSTHERRAFRGVAMFGLSTDIELDETAFASEGDAYVFGSTLQRLLVSETPINSFHRLTVHLHPSRKSFPWNAETGTQTVV